MIINMLVYHSVQKHKVPILGYDIHTAWKNELKSFTPKKTVELVDYEKSIVSKGIMKIFEKNECETYLPFLRRKCTKIITRLN